MFLDHHLTASGTPRHKRGRRRAPRPRRWNTLLRFEPLEQRTVLAAVLATVPSQGGPQVDPATDISVYFDGPMEESTQTEDSITVVGSVSGQQTAQLSYMADGFELRIDPAADFARDETVTVTLTTGVAGGSGVEEDARERTENDRARIGRPARHESRAGVAAGVTPRDPEANSALILAEDVVEVARNAGSFSAMRGSSSGASLSVDGDFGLLQGGPATYYLALTGSPDQGLYHFTTSGTSGDSHFVSITSPSIYANLQLALWDPTGTTCLAESRHVGNEEWIWLPGLAAGTYLVQVFDAGWGYPTNYTLTFNVPGPDDAEPNDTTFKELGALQGPFVLENLSIHAQSDLDWFRFQTVTDGTDSDYVRIDFSNALGNLDLQLYDAAGNRIGSSASASSNYEAISLDGLPVGIYSICVYSSQSHTNPNYRLTIDAPQIPRDRFEPKETTATELGPVQGQLVYEDLTVHTWGDEDWFRFQTVTDGASGDFVAIEFSNQLGNLDLQLYDAAGNRIGNSASAGNDFEYIEINGLPVGTYFVRVYSSQGHVNPNYTFMMDAPEIPEDRFEPNETPPADLGPLLGGWVYDSLTIHAQNDQDWFRFQTLAPGTSADYVRIDFANQLGNLDLFLYDSAGTPLWGSTSANNNFEGVSLEGLPAGTYMVCIYSSQLHVNPNYVLTIEAPSLPADRFEPNESFETAIDLNAELEDDGRVDLTGLTLHAANDFDVFCFDTVTTSTEYHAVATVAEVGANIYLYDENHFLVREGLVYMPDPRFTFVFMEGLPPGRYYVAVTNRPPASHASYTLVVQANVKINDDEKEPNDDVAHATDLGQLAGFQFYPNLTIPRDDTDCFRFELNEIAAERDFVAIDFVHSQGDLDIELYNAAHQMVASSYGIGDGEWISLAELPLGVYYLKVSGFLGESNPAYTLLLQGPESGSSTTIGESELFHESMPVAQQRWDNLTIPTGDQDWFQFEMKQDGRPGDVALIQFDHTKGDLDLVLPDGEGKELERSAGLRNEEYVDLSTRTAGTYYLKVIGYDGASNGRYGLTINLAGTDPFEENDDFEHAKTLNLFSQSTWPNLSIDDDDWFKFELSEGANRGHYVQIDFRHADGDLDLELYGPDPNEGGVPTDWSVGVSDTEQISLDGLSAGEYYLRVFGYGEATNPSYDLTIVAPDSSHGDGCESNDDLTTPTVIDERWRMPDSGLSIHRADDVDWYKLDLKEPGERGDYAAIVLDHTAGDLDLTLYDGSGQTALQTADGVSNMHVVELAGLAKGVYYLQVSGYEQATNRYELYVAAPLSTREGDHAEPNDTLDQATPIATAGGTWQSEALSIHDKDDSDWFWFQLPEAPAADHAVGITFSHEQGDLDLELCDSAGNVLDRSLSIEDREEISLAGLAAGQSYLVHVYGYGGAANPEYRLYYEGPRDADGDAAEPNNAPSQAFNLRQVKGLQTFDFLDLSVHEAGDSDWFRFTTVGRPSEGNGVGILFDERLGDLDLKIYADAEPLGEPLISEEGSFVEFVEFPACGNDAGCSYLIEVCGHDGATNPQYQLLIGAPLPTTGDWAESNDIPDTAEDMQTVKGTKNWSGLSLHSDQDTDWFRFNIGHEGSKSHFVSIEFDHNQGNLALELYESGGVTLARGDDSSRSAHVSDREIVSLDKLPAGEYLVKVSGEANPTYTLTIAAPSSGEPDWAENNNTQDEATDLRTIDGTLTVGDLSLHSTRDTDWYRFYLDRKPVTGNEVRIEFDPAFGNIQALIIDPDNVEHVCAASNGNVSYPLRGLPGGTYLVRIEGREAVPTYQLTIAGTPMATEDWTERHGEYDDNNSPDRPFDLNRVAAIQQVVRRSGGWDPLGLYNLSTGQAGHVEIAGILSNYANVNAFDFIAAAESSAFNPSPTPFNPLASLSPEFSFGPIANITRTPTNNLPSFVQPAHQALFAHYAPSNNYNPLYQQQLQQAQRNLFSNYLTTPLMNQLAGYSFGFGGTGPYQPLNYYQSPNYFQAPSYPTYPLQLVNTLEWIGNNDVMNSLSNYVMSIETEVSTATRVLTELSIHQDGDQDWFSFDLARDGTSRDLIEIRFDHDLGDLWLDLYDSEVHLIESSNGRGDTESIDLSNLRPGRYLIRVAGVGASVIQPDYTLTVTAPLDVEPEPDWAEPNDAPTASGEGDGPRDLRTVEGTHVSADLSLHAHEDGGLDEDWFRFTTTAAATESHFVRIDFAHQQGDLELALCDNEGNELTDRSPSESTEDYERISLAGLVADSYLIHVYGHGDGDANPYYMLTIEAPQTSVPPDDFEPNDEEYRATDLGTGDGLRTLGGLTICASASSKDEDWFQFELLAEGRAGHGVGVDFFDTQGNLDLMVYRKDPENPVDLNNPLWRSTGNEDGEFISLEGVAAGTFYARVLGAEDEDDVSNTYDLYLDLPAVPDSSGDARDDWTVMVYMTASDLERFAFEDINELEHAVSELPSSINFAVLWDQSAEGRTYATELIDEARTAWGGTGQAIIRPDRHEDYIATEFEGLGDEGLAEQNTGDPKTLQDFITWASQEAPADNYALILWNHGGGDLDGFNLDNQDPGGDDRLMTHELSQAIAAAGVDLDVVAFEACNMAQIEVAYALREQVSIFVGSQQPEAGGGQDYGTAFRALAYDPENTTSEAFGTMLVDSFGREYAGDWRGWNTLSATTLSALDPLAGALSAYVTETRSATNDQWQQIVEARNTATSFHGYPDYRDLGQFMVALRDNENYVGTAIAEAARTVVEALQDAVVARSNDSRRVYGLSVYLPSGTIDEGYLERNRDSGFFAATQWDDFLTEFVAHTSGSAVWQDWAGRNNMAPRAYNLHALAGRTHEFDGLQLRGNDDEDWFRFKILAAPGAEDAVSVLSADGADDLNVTLWRVERPHKGSSSFEKIRLDSTPDLSVPGRIRLPIADVPFLDAGSAEPDFVELLIQVASDRAGNATVAYGLEIDAPVASTTSVEGHEWARGNDRTDKAIDLGVTSSPAVYSGLFLDGESTDYFRFATPRNQPEEGQVTVVAPDPDALVRVRLEEQVEDGSSQFSVEAEASGSISVPYPAGGGRSYRISVSTAFDGATGYALTISPSVSVGDSDGDGIPNSVENSAPNGGDGNLDGVPDAEQQGVASLRHPDSGTYVTLVTAETAQLQNVSFAAMPGGVPEGMEFVLELLSFTVAGMDPGGAVTVEAIVHDSFGLNAFYACGPTARYGYEHWYPFVFDGVRGAEISADGRIVVHLADGGRGDNDLAADGSIVVLAGPAINNHPRPWQNAHDRYDVDMNYFVVPQDVLVVINDINCNGSWELPVPPIPPNLPPQFLDVDGNNQITPNDVLALINELNSYGNREVPPPGTAAPPNAAIPGINEPEAEAGQGDLPVLLSLASDVHVGSYPDESFRSVPVGLLNASKPHLESSVRAEDRDRWPMTVDTSPSKGAPKVEPPRASCREIDELWRHDLLGDALAPLLDELVPVISAAWS